MQIPQPYCVWQFGDCVTVINYRSCAHWVIVWQKVFSLLTQQKMVCSEILWRKSPVYLVSCCLPLLYDISYWYFPFLASFEPCWVHQTEEWWAGNCKCAAFNPFLLISGGEAVASWLVGSTLDQVVCVWALAGYFVLCSWARHFTLTTGASLHPDVKLGVGEFNVGGNHDGLASHLGGLEIILVPSCYRNWRYLYM